MSYEIYVVLDASQLPTLDKWQNQINSCGFKLPVTLQFQDGLETATGFQPVDLDGDRTGFEFSLSRTGERPTPYILPGIVVNNSRFALFRWGGRIEEMVAGICAAAALTIITNGIFFDPQTNQTYTSESILPAAMDWIDY